MTEVTDLPDAPDAEATDGFGQMLSDLLEHVDPAGRWALLLSRPGAHPTDELDRAWAGALYDTVRSRGIRHDTIHLATDERDHAGPARRRDRIPSGLVKLMYAAWGDDLADRLRDDRLHQRLAAAGVRRLQLNLDDADVAPAMRIATGPEHIGAIVSVWSRRRRRGDVTAVARGARRARLAGWEVDERLPIPPPEARDGERLDALANVAVLKRPDDLDRDEWLHRWLVDHTPIAIATQATLRLRPEHRHPAGHRRPAAAGGRAGRGAVPERGDGRHARVLRQRRRRRRAQRPAHRG